MTNDLYNSFTADIHSILTGIKDNQPLIHCITNPISINDCANAVLAMGGRPIMAEHPKEAADITKAASSLCLNIGNITDARIESIMLSGKAAIDCGIPSVIDIVGITCSRLRYDFVNNFLANIKPSVIKGNLSEIKKLSNNHASFSGIDSCEHIDTESDLINTVSLIKKLAEKTGSIILASGKTDIISDGNITAAVMNGSKYLPLVTGTGCMLNVIIGTMLASKASTAINKVILGTAIMGICGETAENPGTDNTFHGLGTYHINLIDALSTVTSDIIKENLRIRFF